MKYGRELLKGSTEGLLLSLITQKPMYGYEIIKELEHRSQGYFRFKEGTLYPALHRLEKEKLLESKWQKPGKGPERKYYSITAKGLRVLGAKTEEWLGFSTAVSLILNPATREVI